MLLSSILCCLVIFSPRACEAGPTSNKVDDHHDHLAHFENMIKFPWNAEIIVYYHVHWWFKIKTFYKMSEFIKINLENEYFKCKFEW